MFVRESCRQTGGSYTMKLKKILCTLLAVLVAMLPLLPAAAQRSAERTTLIENAEIYTLSPNLGDGVTVSWANGRSTVNGVLDEDSFTAAETATLTLNAQIADGFTYCPEYSHFFNGDANASVTGSGSSYSFSYTFRQGSSVSREELENINIFTTADSLPRLDINAGIPFSQITKDTWVDASFTLTLGSKQFASGDYSGTGSVKGRGNTSWGQPKRPYSIKLSEKKSLLDIPKTKKYAIVASYSDPSLMRNYLTYKTGLALDGIGYTPKCEFVDVYLNGVYNGIYILVERIDVEKTKIDIEEATAENLTGGYLIEKDAGDKVDWDEDLWVNAPFQSNPNADVFTIKAPEPEDSALADSMRAYLAEYLQRVHNAIMSGTSACFDYVDTASWIDFIIMQEVTKNIDGNLKTSCYMYKVADDDTLNMTALWDFDLAYGLANWDNACSNNDGYDCPSGTGTTGFMVINSSCPWFKHLYEDYPEFRQALLDKYAQYRQTLIPDMLRMIDKQAAYLKTAAAANDRKWNNNSEYGTQELKTWLSGRISWLDRQWMPQEQISLNDALNVAGGSLDFTTDTANAWYGEKSGSLRYAVSGNAGIGSSSSALRLSDIAMQAGDTLSFRYKVSSEASYDVFSFKANGNQKFERSGEIGWTDYTFTAESAGTYSFEWVYSKDYSMDSGDDCAFVDDVRLTTQTTYQPGDVDMDGSITVSDALTAMRCSLELIQLSEQAFTLADMDGDGIVGTSDALTILRLAMHVNR